MKIKMIARYVWNRFFLSGLKNIQGQTAIEYLLMLLVVVSLIYTFMGRLKEYLLKDADACTENSTSFVCSIGKMYSHDYRWFTVRR